MIATLLLAAQLALSPTPAPSEDASPTPQPSASAEVILPAPHKGTFSLPGFQGVAFGASRAETEKVLGKKYRRLIAPDGSVFFRGDFAGFHATQISPEYKNGHFVSVEVMIFSQDGQSSLDIGLKSLEAIEQRYGKPELLYIKDDEGNILYAHTLQQPLPKAEQASMDAAIKNLDDNDQHRFLYVRWSSKEGNTILAYVSKLADPTKGKTFVMEYASPAEEAKQQRALDKDF